MSIDPKYLPSKRFVVSVCIAIFLVILGIALTYIEPSKKEEKTISYENSTSSFSGNYELPDWKIPGASTTTISTIDKFSRSLFTNVLSETQKGEVINDTKASVIADDAIKMLTVKEIPVFITYSSLNLIPVNKLTVDSDLEKFKKVFTTETNVLISIAGQDLKIMNTILSNKDANKKDMEGIIAQYSKIVNNLKKAPLPAEEKSLIAELILQIVGNIQKIIFIDNDILVSNKNTASAYSDIINYYRISQEIATLLNTADYVFKINR